jgi:hypothetical protein
MNVIVQRVSDKASLARFIELSWDVQRADPHWVPPLVLERRDALGKGNPFFEYGEAELFLALRGERVVGRISAQTNKLHAERYEDGRGFFGFFECHNDPEAARLLVDTAAGWLRERGCSHMRGPLSYTMNEEVGVLVEGFDSPPSMLMTHNPPYYDALLTGAGLSKAKDLYAWRYDFSRPTYPKAQEISDFVAKTPGLVVRPVDKSKLASEVRIVMDIFNEAWSDNWGYIPMTERGLAKMAQELKLLLDPEHALVAEHNGEPVCIAIALPDLNTALRDLNGRLFPFGLFKLLYRMLYRKPKKLRFILFGLRKAARGGELFGLSFHLYKLMHDAAKRNGYTEAELSWTLEDNYKINKGIERMGGEIYKRYRVYERPL